MEITQVKVFPVREEKLKAFVSLVFDHCFMVNDIKVIQGKDGLFLSMPSRRKKSGEFKDVAHPLNHETRRRIEERVLDEYRRAVDDVTPRRPDRAEDTDADVASSDAPPPAPVPATPHPAAGPVPAPVAPPAARDAGAPDEAGEAEAEAEDPTLEEVQEMHLRDSFWSVS